MAEKLISIAVQVLETMFFVGVIGCAITVVVSWIEICSEAFSSDDEENEIH